jgi:hypothetical protein
MDRARLRQIIKEELHEMQRMASPEEEGSGFVINNIQISQSGRISVDWSWGESFEQENVGVSASDIAPLIADAVNDLIEEMLPRSPSRPAVGADQVARALAIRQSLKMKEQV